jgi:hypothetical protein
VTAALASSRPRLEVLKMILAAGCDQWWAMPIVLESSCTRARRWEDDSLVQYAQALYESTEAFSDEEPPSRSFVSALRSHPSLFALVALIANERDSLLEAAVLCTGEERRQLSRIAFASAAKQDCDMAACLDLNMGLWFAVLKQIENARSGADARKHRVRPRVADQGISSKAISASARQGRLRWFSSAHTHALAHAPAATSPHGPSEEATRAVREQESPPAPSRAPPRTAPITLGSSYGGAVLQPPSSEHAAAVHIHLPWRPEQLHATLGSPWFRPSAAPCTTSRPLGLGAAGIGTAQDSSGQHV